MIRPFVRLLTPISVLSKVVGQNGWAAGAIETRLGLEVRVPKSGESGGDITALGQDTTKLLASTQFHSPLTPK